MENCRTLTNTHLLESFGSNNLILELLAYLVGTLTGAGFADDGESADVADAGEGLAAEAESVDALEVVELLELGGGEALAHDPQVLPADAAAIVLDLDELEAALPHLHAHAGRARVQAVLHQLLQRIERPLDDLARRDSVH